MLEAIFLERTKQKVNIVLNLLLFDSPLIILIATTKWN